MEFASIWRGMGGTVDLFFRKELPLRCAISFCFFFWSLAFSLEGKYSRNYSNFYFHRGFDDEMRALVARNLEGRGVNLHPQTSLTQVSDYDCYFSRLICYLQFVLH